MKQDIFIIIGNDSFICKRQDDLKPYIFKLDGIKGMPNIPFYHQFEFDTDKHRDDFISFKKQMFKGSLATGFLKPKVFLALPDDSVYIDRRYFEEFFYKCGAQKVFMIKECMLLSKSQSYVAITRSCRMTALSYIKDREFQNTIYIENKDYSVDVMKSKINDLFTAYESNNLPVVLNGENLEKCSEIGEIISPETMLNNYIELVKTKFSNFFKIRN